LPHALKALAGATSEVEAAEAYWQIDNVAVVQGRLFEAAEYVIWPAVLMLTNSNEWVTTCALDLIIQLTAGDVDSGELGVNDGLNDRVRSTAQKGLSVVYRLLESTSPGIRERAIEVLEAIEDDRARLIQTLKEVSLFETSASVREMATSVIAARSSG
jgi:hypothetical protein